MLLSDMGNNPDGALVGLALLLLAYCVVQGVRAFGRLKKRPGRPLHWDDE